MTNPRLHTSVTVRSGSQVSNRTNPDYYFFPLCGTLLSFHSYLFCCCLLSFCIYVTNGNPKLSASFQKCLKIWWMYYERLSGWFFTILLRIPVFPILDSLFPDIVYVFFFFPSISYSDFLKNTLLLFKLLSFIFTHDDSLAGNRILGQKLFVF